MMKITLDTNLLIELLDFTITPSSVPALGRILRHCFDHQGVDLKITTAADSDLLKDKIPERAAALKLRIDNGFSVLGAGYVTKDHLPEDETERKNFSELQKVLFSNLNPREKRYGNKINDVHHLHRHIRSERNIFVTNDSDILKKKELLKSAFTCVVMNPSECADFLDALDLSSQYPSKKHAKRPDYYSPEFSGEARFDFKNNDGKYMIGTGDLIFEAHWSERGTDSMYIYNDSINIEALTVAEDVSRFKELKEFQFYDSTSRAREPRKDKDIIMLKNSKGYFAALKITDIQLKSRGGVKNELVFQYVIQPNRTSIFRGLK